MKLFDYLGCTSDHLEMLVGQRMIDRANHPEFPLALLCYGRKTVYDNLWDSVTTKCRGLIYNTETLEIVARPFEKFFNYGSEDAKLDINGAALLLAQEPEIYEKLDGFLAILYQYNDQEYIASKGSFTSPHAKWATNWYQKHKATEMGWNWPKNCTPVFEGITRNLRIVVDYGEADELRLLGLVNNETGDEASYATMLGYGIANGIKVVAKKFDFNMAAALKQANEATKNFEGYVLVWRRPGQPPFRLKVKFLEYLRLHRFVTQVSPKRIVEALENGWDSVLDEYVENSTPWFSEYVTKWRKYFQNKYEEIEQASNSAFAEIDQEIQREFPFGFRNLSVLHEGRKYFAALATSPENKPISGIIFGILDGKDIRAMIWKKVRDEVKGRRPMVDAHM